jgi:hypothetical protein
MGLWSSESLGGLLLVYGTPIAGDEQETLDTAHLVLLTDGGARQDLAVPGKIPLALSPDGAAMLFSTGLIGAIAEPGLALGLLSSDPSAGLSFAISDKLRLAAGAAGGAASATGDRFWVTLPDARQVVELQ